MSRVPAFRPDDLSVEQKRLCAEIGGPRDGMVNGPFRPWILANPPLAEAMNQVGAVLRFQGMLGKRLLEIVVLRVARHWRSDFQWSAHVPLALRFGVARAVIDAIHDGAPPPFETEQQRLAYRCAEALLEEQRLPQQLYNELLAAFGFDVLVEMITILGQYSMANIVTNAFEIEPIDGTRHFR